MSQGGCSAGFTEPFALRVIGESMAPEFLDGHIIIVDPGHQLVHGAYAVIQMQEEVYFGLYQSDGKRHRLEYLNPAFPVQELDGPFELKGVVVQRSTGRRRELKHYDYGC